MNNYEIDVLNIYNAQYLQIEKVKESVVKFGSKPLITDYNRICNQLKEQEHLIEKVKFFMISINFYAYKNPEEFLHFSDTG